MRPLVLTILSVFPAIMAEAMNRTTIVPSTDPLTTLIRRLEAATSRLEDIATSASSHEQPNGVAAANAQIPQSSSAPELPQLAKNAPAAAPAAPAAPALPPALQDMDTLIKEDVGKFVSTAAGLDKNIEAQVRGSMELGCQALT